MRWPNKGFSHDLLKICRCLNIDPLLKFRLNKSLHFKNKSYIVQTSKHYLLKNKLLDTRFSCTENLKHHIVV